jgi:TPR repeat protein
MTTLQRERRYIQKWRPKALRGDTIAMSNVAAAYRILGNFRLSARWYQRAAKHRDGDALTEWGYCLQHGAGVRKNGRASERAYRAAIRSKWITDYCREEAMYHLAVLLLGRRSTGSRSAAARLLRMANVDGDYPQAQALLRGLRSADGDNVCICRRHLRARLASKQCPLHNSQKRQPAKEGPGRKRKRRSF